MKPILLKTNGLILLMLFSLSISASGLPDYYPEKLNHMQGNIDDIDIRTGRIIINDIPWKLSMNVKVHSMSTEFSSVQTLKKGTYLAFKVDTINGKSEIAEIWILPKFFSRPALK